VHKIQWGNDLLMKSDKQGKDEYLKGMKTPPIQSSRLKIKTKSIKAILTNLYCEESLVSYSESELKLSEWKS